MRPQPDAAAHVDIHFGLTNQDVKKFERRLQTLGGPDCMIAHAFGVAGAVYASDHVSHVYSSVRDEIGVDVGLVVNGVPVDHGRTGFVHANDINGGGVAAEFKNDLVERLDAGDIPEVGSAYVNGDVIHRFVEVERRDETLRRGKKHLPRYGVIASPPILDQLRLHLEKSAHLGGEE